MQIFCNKMGRASSFIATSFFSYSLSTSVLFLLLLSCCLGTAAPPDGLRPLAPRFLPCFTATPSQCRLRVYFLLTQHWNELCARRCLLNYCSSISSLDLTKPWSASRRTAPLFCGTALHRTSTASRRRRSWENPSRSFCLFTNCRPLKSCWKARYASTPARQKSPSGSTRRACAYPSTCRDP